MLKNIEAHGGVYINVQMHYRKKETKTDMDDNTALVESMLDGSDDYLIGRNIFNQMFVDDHKKDQEAHPRSGDHASDYKQPFQGDWRYCFRKSILQEFYIYDDEELSPKRIRINKLGWYIHVMLQRLIKQSGRAIEIEKTHIHPKFGIYYTPDAIMYLRELVGEEHVIVEFKSMNKSSYEKAVDYHFDNALKGHPDAYKQLQIYLYLSGLKKGLIFLYCKDNSDFHYYLVDYDPLFMEPYIERIETRLKLKIIFESKGQLPKKVCADADATRVKSCPVGKLCFLKNQIERSPYLRTKGHGLQQNVSMIHEDNHGD